MGREDKLLEFMLANNDYRGIADILEVLPLPIIFTDVNGFIVYVNSAFEDVYQFNANDVIGHTPSMLKSGEIRPEEYKHLWDSISNGKTWEGSLHNKKKNGEMIWIKNIIAPRFNRDEKIYGYVAIQGNDEAFKQLSEVQRSQQYLTILGMESGTIRHTMNNIIGRLEFMTYRLQQKTTDPIVAQELTKIMEGVHSAGTVLGAGLISKKMDGIEPKIIDANSFVSYVRQFVESQEIMRSKKYSLDERLESARKINIVPSQFSNMLYTLLSNAMDAMPEGGKITYETQDIPHDHEAVPKNLIGNYVRFSVSDTGAGIPDEISKRLFHQDFISTKGGLGTGLHLLDIAIKHYHGVVEYHTSTRPEDHGSTFQMYLPAVK